jgi:pimeloyl-ACP methyl ester carboxylesterase
MEDRLARITCPVLVIQGAKDEFGTEHQVDTIIANVSGAAQKLMVEDVGHTPHKDAAGFTLEVAGGFIKQALQAEQTGAGV